MTLQDAIADHLHKYCQYVKSGEHHGKYVLKEYLRNKEAAAAAAAPTGASAEHGSAMADD